MKNFDKPAPAPISTTMSCAFMKSLIHVYLFSRRNRRLLSFFERNSARERARFPSDAIRLLPWSGKYTVGKKCWKKFKIRIRVEGFRDSIAVQTRPIDGVQ